MREAFRGPLFRVEIETWRGGDRRDVVRHPSACAAAVFDEARRLVLVRQVREPLRARILEVPAGVYDVPGEPPDDAVRREVREETGLTVTRTVRIGSILPSPGFSDERIDLFAARAHGTLSPEEGIEPVPLPFGQARRAVLEGEIADGKTALAILLVDALGLAP